VGGGGTTSEASQVASPDQGSVTNLASTAPAASWTPTAPAPAAATIAPQYSYDAYIDMGQGPFASSASLTGGGAQGWWNSSLVQSLYGHTPTAQEQTDFTSTIMKDVQQTFDLSHVPVTLTATEGASAAHSVALVSHTNYPANPNAVGIANVGGDGFSFIDQFKYATSVNDLEWAVAHNIAHELMHTFGGNHHDLTGNYLDTATISWDKLIDPNLTFGPASVAELSSLNFLSRSDQGAGAEQIEVTPSPVPEPATLLAWSLAAAGAVLIHRRRAA
jgi:hypothetical protein